MDAELRIEDVTPTVLDFDAYRNRGASPLYEFFQFARYPREFADPAALSGCRFYDLSISYRVEWGAPHPGIFEDFFPTILRRLVGEGGALTLFVKSLDRSYHDELRFIEGTLAPANLSYVLLPNPLRPGDRRTQVDVGHLVFEWPADSAERIADEWFMSPLVSVEGYVAPAPPLAEVAALYFRPDTEERIRQLLRTVEVGFRVWPDNNGLFLLTDKLSAADLHERLRTPELNAAIAEAARRYEADSESVP